jgi:hypothetical protein
MIGFGHRNPLRQEPPQPQFTPLVAERLRSIRDHDRPEHAGKTLCGSFDAFHDRKAAHVLSAFATDGQIILGHLAISQKSNEIPAAQDMIATLGLSGRLFTLDAMHCQKNIRNRPRHGQPSVGSTEGEPGQPV